MVQLSHSSQDLAGYGQHPENLRKSLGDASPTKKDMKAKSGCLMSDIRLDIRCETRGIAHRLGKIWICIDLLDEGFLVVFGVP